MSLLVFQIVIKQWDRSQCTPEHVAVREQIPVCYSISAKPAYYVLEMPCIVDQHGDDVPTSVFKNGRIKYGIMPDQRIRFDRFQVSNGEKGDAKGDEKGLSLEYLTKDKQYQFMGRLNEGWIQCQYNWRYSVEESGQRYWMYEEVTLNAACMDELDADLFVKSTPVVAFIDDLQ